MSSDTLNKIVTNLSKLTVSEAAELSKLLEKKWPVKSNIVDYIKLISPSTNITSNKINLDDGSVFHGMKKNEILYMYKCISEFIRKKTKYNYQ